MSDHNANQDTAKNGYKYAHMCRDEHIQIGHNDSGDDERCPVCRERDRAESAESSLQAVREELRVAIEDGDADFWKARAESSAALVRELAQALQKWQQFSKDCIPSDAAGMDELTGYDRLTESLLSDPAVKKVLEK